MYRAMSRGIRVAIPHLFLLALLSFATAQASDHALVTSGPLLNGPRNSLNSVWSAVELPSSEALLSARLSELECELVFAYSSMPNSILLA